MSLSQWQGGASPIVFLSSSYTALPWPFGCFDRLVVLVLVAEVASPFCDFCLCRIKQCCLYFDYELLLLCNNRGCHSPSLIVCPIVCPL